MTCSKYCRFPFYSSACWEDNISATFDLVFKESTACLWKSEDSCLVNCLVASFQLQNPLTTKDFYSVPVNHTFPSLAALQQLKQNKILCVIVMYPTKTMAPRQLETFVNLFRTSKSARWKVTTYRMARCVREIFDFILWIWHFIHLPVKSKVASAAQTKYESKSLKQNKSTCEWNYHNKSSCS